MKRNPYKFKGPLIPGKDKLVLVPRSRDLERVCAGIEDGEYWAVLGSRQTGCTTFLRQIMNQIKNVHPLEIDFETCPTDEKDFYQCLIEDFIKGIPSELNERTTGNWKEINSAHGFLKFLEEFRPKKDIEKILLLFDEIEEIPGLIKFLSMWRQIYCSGNAKLRKYAIVIACSHDPISLTLKTSPYNITEKLYMKDFSRKESGQLIEEPFAEINIRINFYAKEKLLSQINGHPQLLQHACHLLVDTAIREARGIVEEDVDESIKTLLTKDLIGTLKKDVTENDTLKALVKNILEGKKIPYHLNSDFFIKGAGCIVEDENGNCAIRNKIFEKFLEDFFENQKTSITTQSKLKPNPESIPIEEKPIVFICYSKKDKKWKNKLLVQLKVLEAHGIFITWNDDNIPPGEQWFKEIKRNLIQAKIAIILITANSLSSDFILHEEIPDILGKKEKEGILIIPAWAEHCNWESVVWLKRMQMWPNDGKPIEGRSTAEQNKIFTKITKSISKFLMQNGEIKKR